MREFRVSLAAGSTSIARREGYRESAAEKKNREEAGGDDLAISGGGESETYEYVGGSRKMAQRD